MRSKAALYTGATRPSTPQLGSEVPKELICETVWIREREEVAAGQLVDLGVQSLLRHPTLEVDRKEAIVASGDHVDRNLGPGFESARLTEHDVGLGALVRLALLDDLGRDVVEEVRGEVEVSAVATPVCGRYPRCDRFGVVPPLSNRLAGNRNHRVDEHQHAHANLRAHQRRREATERLYDEDDLTRPDRLEDAISVGRETGSVVVAVQVDRDRHVPRFFEEGHDPMPVPRHALWGALTRSPGLGAGSRP
jgi:hypothetical protein